MDDLSTDASKKSQESRRSRRYAVDAGVLDVAWLDKTGKMRTTRAHVLNISETGMALEFPEEVMPLRVRFESERFKVKGAGTVRYCRRLGAKYMVGVEFADGLTWRPPRGDVKEPIQICDPKSVYAALRKGLEASDVIPPCIVRKGPRLTFDEWSNLLLAEYSQPPIQAGRSSHR